MATRATRQDAQGALMSGHQRRAQVVLVHDVGHEIFLDEGLAVSNVDAVGSSGKASTTLMVTPVL